MTNQEILTKAISKAIDGGWRPKASQFKPGGLINPRVSGSHDDTLGAAWSMEARYDVIWMSYRDVIFNHNFAKALWGEPEPASVPGLYTNGYGKVTTIGWQYHLQQIVVSENPIEYLGENI